MSDKREGIAPAAGMSLADVQAAERVLRVLVAGLPPANWAHTPVPPAPIASPEQVEANMAQLQIARLTKERDDYRKALLALEDAEEAWHAERQRLQARLDEAKRQASKALVECYQAEKKAQREHELCQVAEDRADELVDERDALIEDRDALIDERDALKAELAQLRCGGAVCTPGPL